MRNRSFLLSVANCRSRCLLCRAFVLHKIAIIGYPMRINLGTSGTTASWEKFIKHYCMASIQSTLAARIDVFVWLLKLFFSSSAYPLLFQNPILFSVFIKLVHLSNPLSLSLFPFSFQKQINFRKCLTLVLAKKTMVKGHVLLIPLLTYTPSAIFVLKYYV